MQACRNTEATLPGLSFARRLFVMLSLTILVNATFASRAYLPSDLEHDDFPIRELAGIRPDCPAIDESVLEGGTGCDRLAVVEPERPAAGSAAVLADGNSGLDRPADALALTAEEVAAARLCLSLNVYWEARNQPLAGQLAVAQVTMNRVLDSRYPNDVCEVVYDHKQFSWYWDGNPDRPKERRAWETAMLVASAAMEGTGNAALEGVTHYHAVYSQPYWKDYLTQVVTIGDHVFYTE